jgi:hypothetical protein
MNGNPVKFRGEDILGFCLFNSGLSTTGLWHMALDGSMEGMPKNATSSLAIESSIDDMYFTTKGNFNVDAASGGHSEVYHFDGAVFSGPLFSAPDTGLAQKVDALDIEFSP